MSRIGRQQINPSLLQSSGGGSTSATVSVGENQPTNLTKGSMWIDTTPKNPSTLPLASTVVVSNAVVADDEPDNTVSRLWFDLD